MSQSARTAAPSPARSPVGRHDIRQDFRHVYSPGADRMPRWVWRLWAWF